MPLLMRAEDLHVAPLTTWWNSKGPWASLAVPAQPLACFDGNRFYQLLGGKDEHGGGALLKLARNGRVDRISLPSLITVHDSGWFLVRAIADVTNTFRFASTGFSYDGWLKGLNEGRIRFAHTAPRWFDIPGQPLKPRKEEVSFLIRRVQDQIQRSTGVLPPEAIAEYRKALEIYERIAVQAAP